MKHKYETRVSVVGPIEETQFIRQGDAPRIKARYVRDEKEHGKYTHGKAYSIDPEKLDAEAEETVAEQQRAESEAQVESMGEKLAAAEAKAATKGKKK